MTADGKDLMDVCVALDLGDSPDTLAAWARLGTTRHVISYERGTSEQLPHLQCALEMKNLIFAAVLTREKATGWGKASSNTVVMSKAMKFTGLHDMTCMAGYCRKYQKMGWFRSDVEGFLL